MWGPLYPVRTKTRRKAPSHTRLRGGHARRYFAPLLVKRNLQNATRSDGNKNI